MEYSELLSLLKEKSEEEFAIFQKKLIPTKQHILGVRTPILRELAKSLKGQEAQIFTFPDEICEVTFLKLAMVSALSYEEFILYIDKCVEKIDNWATCDCFKAKCIKKHQREFLPILESLFMQGGEFYERYVLVTLLSFYIEREYLPIIESFLQRADTSKFYVHMASAWLTAEVVVHFYEFGIFLLKKGILSTKTHNKAIQKCIDSYRLTKEQKDFLRSLKK